MTDPRLEPEAILFGALAEAAPVDRERWERETFGPFRQIEVIAGVQHEFWTSEPVSSLKEAKARGLLHRDRGWPAHVYEREHCVIDRQWWDHGYEWQWERTDEVNLTVIRRTELHGDRRYGSATGTERDPMICRYEEGPTGSEETWYYHEPIPGHFFRACVRHREDGPARTRIAGGRRRNEWWLDGERMTKGEWLAELRRRGIGS